MECVCWLWCIHRHTHIGYKSITRRNVTGWAWTHIQQGALTGLYHQVLRGVCFYLHFQGYTCNNGKQLNSRSSWTVHGWRPLVLASVPQPFTVPRADQLPLHYNFFTWKFFIISHNSAAIQTLEERGIYIFFSTPAHLKGMTRYHQITGQMVMVNLGGSDLKDKMILLWFFMVRE